MLDISVRKRIGILIASLRTPSGYPNGHPYSPVADPEVLAAREGALWARDLPAAGVGLDIDAHRAFIEGVLARHAPLYDYPDRAASGYYSDNEFFGWLDSRLLLAMLMEHRSRRVVEVGSGFSSLLLADVNQRHLGGEVHITCVDPEPRTEIRGTKGIAAILRQEVQDVPLEFFAALADGDILFIDSSHVCKTGSDVNYLLLDVLPTLAPGVIVHFHDVFIPFEYPKEWVLGENRGWNEQYLLQAFLSMNDAYHVLFGAALAGRYCKRELEALFGAGSAAAQGGCSFWIRRARDVPARSASAGAAGNR